MSGLNGARIIERRETTIFVRLPREQWRLALGPTPCRCPVCTTTGRAAFWDTLAIATEKTERNDTAWTVHHPDPNEYDLIDVYTLDADGNAVVRKQRTVEGPGYWSLLVPWSPYPTRWHPTERVGSFSTLSRGCFPHEQEAHQWALDNLGGQPYRVAFYQTHELFVRLPNGDALLCDTDEQKAVAREKMRFYEVASLPIYRDKRDGLGNYELTSGVLSAE